MKPRLRHHFDPVTWPRWLALLFFALLSVAHCACPPARAAGVVANPPILVLFDAPAVAIAPNGAHIAIPAGAVVDACGATPIVYDLAGSTVRIVQPCAARPLFADGFEGTP